MKIDLREIIDFKKVDILLNGFKKTTGFVTAILDLEGNILSKSGWSHICAEFHRVNPDYAKICTYSDTELASKIKDGENIHFYKCLNGLIDVAVPIVINGEHMGNLFSGQFFFEEPDRDFFRSQAKAYGFDEQKYLAALGKVPVVSKEKVLDAMEFLLNMTRLISEMAVQKLELEELNRNIRASENRFTKAFHSSPMPMVITSKASEKIIEVNETWCRVLGYAADEVIGLSPLEIGILDPATLQQITTQREQKRADNKIKIILKNKSGEPLNFLFSSETAEVGGEICDICTMIDITDSVLVEEKFKSVFESANVGKSITQLTGEINVNKAFCEMLGYTQEELSNKKWQDITPVEDLPVVQNHLEPLLKGEKKSTRFEKRYICKNGTYLWTDVSVSVLKDSRDKPLHFITTIIDISQRKLAEQALLESNDRLQKVLKNDTVGVMFWDLTTGSMIDANDTFLNMMGYSRKDVQERELTWQKLTPPEYHQISLAEIEKFQKTGRVGPYEKEYLCKDGSRRWLVFAGSALEGNTCVEFCVDISDRKESESALRLERDFSKSVIDSLPGVFYCYDENLKFKRWNKNFEVVTGYSQDEIELMSPLDLFAGSEKDLLLQKIRNVFATGFAEVEAHFATKDGTLIPYFFTGASTVIGGQKHLVGVGIDISDRKRSEKALQDSEQKFSTLFEESSYAITLSSLPDGMILNVNSAFEQIFGYSKDETRGKTALELGINPDVDDRQRLYAELQKNGFVRNLDIELRIKSGEKRLFLINSDLIEIGSKKYFLNTIDDITERRQAEEKQARTYELLTNLARLVPGVIYQYRLYPDGHSAFPYASPGMYSIYEVTPEQVREDATPVFGRLHPEDADRVSNLIFESARTLKEFYCEFRVILPEQGLRWRWSQAHPERTADGGTLWHGIISDITELKQAENALRESERHLRLSQQIAHLGSWQLDLATNKVLWTEELYKMYGFDPALPPPPYTEHMKLFTPESWERLSTSLALTRETGIPYVLELETIKEDGSNGWMWVRGEVTKDPAGNTVGLLGAAQDITERKRIENTLRESEERFRRAIMSAPIPIMIHAEDGQVITVNTPWTELSGYQHSDIPTIFDWTRLVYGKQMDLVRKQIDLSYSLDSPKAEGEYSITTKSGEQRIWNFYSARVGNLPDGRRLVISMALDVTDSKNAELEKKKFFLLAESSSEFIGMCDLEMNPIYVNPAGQILVGLPDMVSACSVKVQDYFFPEDRRFIVEEFFPRVLREGHGDVEIRLRHFKTGEPIWMYYYLFRVQDAGGTPIGWATVSHDITERKRMLNELEELNAELEQKVIIRTAQLEGSNRELESFSYSVSHDLRAPLRHIIGYINLLNHQFHETLPEKAEHYLNEITDSAEQMGELIDDLLQFSKTSKQELRQTYFDMNQAVNEVRERLTEQTENRKISWKIAELPEVFGDYSLLKLVWTNLLENAVKYSKGRDEAKIEIGCDQEPGYWVFYVKDNGAGFDMKYAQKLFGVFQRLHSQSQFEGTGIGLANVQRIIHKHGGRVWAFAEPEKGATFYFTIPNNLVTGGET